MNQPQYEIHELMITRLASEMTDEGEHVVIMGSFTPLAYAAYMLGKLTHAQDSWLGGYNAMGIRPIELSLTGSEAAVYRGATFVSGFNQNGWLFHLGTRGLLECVSSAQMDGDGAINLSVIGDYASPKVRLPGGAGSPEVVQNYRRMVAYFTKHDRRTLVEKVDFATGRRVPIDADRRRSLGLCPGPILIVTPLAVLRKDGDDTPFELESVHPGVEVDSVIENTGFEVTVPESVGVTPTPSEEQLRLLRERIDPSGTARFDFLTGTERLEYLKALLEREWDKGVALAAKEAG